MKTVYYKYKKPNEIYVWWKDEKTNTHHSITLNEAELNVFRATSFNLELCRFECKGFKMDLSDYD